MQDGLPDESVNFNMFVAMHKKYPSVLFPLIFMQNYLRKVTFGKNFWVARREKMGFAADVNQMHSERLELMATAAEAEHKRSYLAEEAANASKAKKGHGHHEKAPAPTAMREGEGMRRKPKHVKHKFDSEHKLDGHVSDAHVEATSAVAEEEHHHRKKKKKHRREAEDS